MSRLSKFRAIAGGHMARENDHQRDLRCRRCGSTVKPHIAEGLCRDCWREAHGVTVRDVDGGLPSLNDARSLEVLE